MKPLHMLMILALAAASPLTPAKAMTSDGVTTVPVTSSGEPATTSDTTDPSPPTTSDTTNPSQTTTSDTTGPSPTTTSDTTAPSTTSSSELTTDSDHTLTSSPEPQTTSSSPTVITVTTNCSETALLLPPPANSSDVLKRLVVTFPDSVVGTKARCTWTLPALDNLTSNVFTFHTTYPQAACNHSMPSDFMELYDVSPKWSFWLLLADSCSGNDWLSTDMWGYPTTIRYTSNIVSNTSVVLGTYSLSTLPKQRCPNGSRQWTALSEPSVLTYPGDGLRIPNLAECSWAFKPADPAGVVRVVIRNRQDDIQKIWCNALSTKRIVLGDTGYDEVGNYVSLDLCPNEVNLTYESFSNLLFVNLSQVAYGGAAPFSIEFSSHGPEVHCPVGSPRVIQVPKSPLGIANFFMGMNRVAQDGQAQTCTWELVAPEGMVVRATKLYAKDYNSSASDDALVIDDGENLLPQPLPRNSTDSFPVWGNNASTMVKFTAWPGSSGKRFVLEYVAVPTAECQGHPILREAFLQPMLDGIPGLPYGDTYGNSDCRWVFWTNTSDTVVQATILLEDSTMYACRPRWYHAYNGTQRAPKWAVKPTCPNDTTLVFRSSSNSLLLVHRRLPGFAKATVSYKAVPAKPSPPSGALRLEASPPVLWSALVLVCVSFGLGRLVPVIGVDES